MKIGVVSSKSPGQIDQLISEVAAKLEAEGLHLSGVVKVLDNEQDGDHYCDMDVRVLPAGPQIRITQSLGEGSTGCRLNPAGIAEAVVATEKNDPRIADLFVLNKFGPQESDGRGFCDAIAIAMEHDTPVLIGVGEGCRAAFETFVDGMSEPLQPDQDAIYNWCKTAIS